MTNTNTVAQPGYANRAGKDFRVAGSGCNAAGLGAPSGVAGVEPNTIIESGPTVNGRSMTFEFSSSKPGSSFECDLDGPGRSESFGPCVGPKTFTDLGPGSYTIHVRAKVGSVVDATPATAPFTIPVVCHQIATVGTTRDTAQELVDALRAGETGCFRGGDYFVGAGADPRYLVITKPGITLRSHPGEVATLHGVWQIQHEAPDVALESMVLDAEHPTQANGILIFGDRTVIRHNDISNGGNTGICIHVRDQAQGVLPDGFLITRNRVHHCGVANNNQHGIYVLRGNGTISGNVVYSNADRGIQLWQDADDVKIFNNTVVGNGSNIAVNDHASSGACCSQRNLVELNVVSHATPRGLLTDHPWNLEAPTLWGTGNVMRNNCVYAEAPGHTYRGGIETGIENRLTLGSYEIANPLYPNRAAGDLRVSQSSACRGNPSRGASDEIANPVGFLPR